MNVVILSDYGHLNGAVTKVALLGARALAEPGCTVAYVHAVGRAASLLDHPNIRVRDLAIGGCPERAEPGEGRPSDAGHGARLGGGKASPSEKPTALPCPGF